MPRLISPEQFDLVKSLLAAGEPHSVIQQKTRVSERTIYRIASCRMSRPERSKTRSRPDGYAIVATYRCAECGHLTWLKPCLACHLKRSRHAVAS